MLVNNSLMYHLILISLILLAILSASVYRMLIQCAISSTASKVIYRLTLVSTRFVKARLSGGDDLCYNWTTSSFLWQRLLYRSWCSVNFDSYYTSLPNGLCSRSFMPTQTTLVNQVSNWHSGMRKYLRTNRITALRLRTRIITIFSFDRTRKSKSFSLTIFFMIPKEPGQNKTTRAI